MKSEELAVLRILYKRRGLLKLSVIVEGFPDESRYHIEDAIASLQLKSFVNIIECSSGLYVSMNRQVRRIVLELLEENSERSAASRILDNDVRLNQPFQLRQVRMKSDAPYRVDLNLPKIRPLLLASLQRAIRLGTILVFSFVILGTVSVLNFQTTSNDGIYSGYDNGSPLMFASSSSLVTEMQKGKTIPVEYIYNSQPENKYLIEPAIYEGIFTKLVSQPDSDDDPQLYYHYIISESKGLLLLEQIRPGLSKGDSNSSLSKMSAEPDKKISTT